MAERGRGIDISSDVSGDVSFEEDV